MGALERDDEGAGRGADAAPPAPSLLARLSSGLLFAHRPGFAAVQSVLLQGLTVLANLVTGIITARLLGAQGRGFYAVAVTWPALLGMAALAGTGDGLLLRLRREPLSATASVAWAALVALALSAMLSGVAYLLMPRLLGHDQQDALEIARLGLLLTPFVATGALFRQSFAGRGKFLLGNLAAFLPHLLHAVAVALFALTSALTVGTAVASLFCGVIASQLVLLRFLLREIGGPVAGLKAAASWISNFARRAAPAELLTLCSSWADRLVLIMLLAPRELGLYAVAYGFSRVVTIATPPSGILLSTMSGREPREAKRLHDTAVRFCIAALATAVAIFFVLSDWLIHVFYGAEFLPAVGVFKILVLQAAVNQVAMITAQLYLSMNRPTVTSCIEFIAVAVSATLMVWLSPQYGARGAAIGLLAGTSTRLVLLWCGLITHLGLSLPRLWINVDDLRTARSLLKA